ncbi:hypothetical protein CPB86DRAFT_761541 [Serendipita vermifera]|nr:hypothetical protein CPB86DRAFT_761541 [Serendipita vermifera]
MSVSAAPNELTSQSATANDANQQISLAPGQDDDDLRVGNTINTDGGVANVNTNNEGPSNSLGRGSREGKSRRLPISAAFADREIALGVWKAAADRNDDVRDALGRMMGWVEELISQLQEAFKANKELEDTLTVTRSNLALALSNTEMLEEALRKEAAGKRVDVGWARSNTASPMPNSSPSFSSSMSNTPGPKNEAGFFKFLRNNTGGKTPPQSAHHSHQSSLNLGRAHTFNSSIDSTASASPTLHRVQGHLVSPSMPSLHSSPAVLGGLRREEELSQALENERANANKILKEKQNLEEELESLSQALFEEANRMVATERRQRAQIEEELQNVRQEREALKGALRIVEGENASLRSGTMHSKKASLASLESSSSSLRERPRALTIDTEKAGNQGGGEPGQVIDLSQTPSTSELRAVAPGQTQPSAIDAPRDSLVASEMVNRNRVDQVTGQVGSNRRTSTSNERAASHSRRNTGNSVHSLKKSDSDQANAIMRGGITFGI